MSNQNEEVQLSSIITQVQRNGNPQDQRIEISLQDKKKKRSQIVPKGVHTFFHYICSCFQPSENAISPPTNIEYHQDLLPPLSPENINKKTLVIDLDETLVHSSFAPPEQPDLVIPVEIEGKLHNVFVLKRPGLDNFLRQMQKLYEIVIYTASLSKYGHPLLDQIDKDKLIDQRLFRESCIIHEGQYVKDLSLLGRDLSKVIIIDNSPNSYKFQPENAIPIKSWYDDQNDTELQELIPILQQLAKISDVRTILRRALEKQKLLMSPKETNQLLVQKYPEPKISNRPVDFQQDLLNESMENLEIPSDIKNQENNNIEIKLETSETPSNNNKKQININRNIADINSPTGRRTFQLQ